MFFKLYPRSSNRSDDGSKCSLFDVYLIKDNSKKTGRNDVSLSRLRAAGVKMFSFVQSYSASRQRHGEEAWQTTKALINYHFPTIYSSQDEASS